MSSATAPLAPASPSLIDYGPVGTLPTTPGVVCFPEKGGSKYGGMVVTIFGGLFALMGIIGFATGSPSGGVKLLLLGAAVALGGWYLGRRVVHQDLVADNLGLTLRQGSRTKGDLPPVHVPWASVVAARCDHSVQTSGSGETESTTVVYAYSLDTAAGTPISTSNQKLKSLDAFMEYCNQHTPQLGYRWIKTKDAKGLPILQSSGTHYVAVPR